MALPQRPVLARTWRGWLNVVSITLLSCITLPVQADKPLIPPGAFVTVGPDGHLVADGNRVRFWGVIGGFPNYPDIDADTPSDVRQRRIKQAYADVDLLIDRFESLGFNFVRTIIANHDGRGGPVDYVKGDGSIADLNDYFLHRLRERGFRVWTMAFSRTERDTAAEPEHVDMIDDPATAEGWLHAVEQYSGRSRGRAFEGRIPLHKNPVVVWDERFEAIKIAQMLAVADHYNQHAEMRWADDPVFAVWETNNEQWWLPRMLAGQWQRQPEFFRRSLLRKWHAFLRENYRDDAGLALAWTGLLPGESLDAGTVLLAPMAKPMDVSLLNDAGGVARIGSVTQQLGPDDFSGRRASDVLRFFTEMLIAHKQRLSDAIKPHGLSLSRSPLIWDTGRGEGIQIQHMLAQADAVAHDAYINGHALHQKDEHWPWDSGLDEYPRINEGVPWLEHNRPVGKPFLCYETQIQQPAKYRAEFPMRLASLGAIQDWDAACWHYWGPVRDIGTTDRPFDRRMDITVGGHPQGYHYTFDAVQAAVMRVAGLAFIHGHLDPAPSPTVFTFGRESLYDPDSLTYGHAYDHKLPDFNATTYHYGMRLIIDPSRPDNVVEGPVVRYNNRSLPSPARPTDQIAYHWRKSSLIWDAPGVVGYGGFLARWGDEVVFEQNLTLRNVVIDNPPEIAYPVDEDERYVVMLLASATAEPLATTDHAVLALKSTSFNDGFTLGMEAGGRNVPGDVPVREARVAADLIAPWLVDMRYSFRDWHDRELASGRVGPDGVLHVPNDLPVWTVELRR